MSKSCGDLLRVPHSPYQHRQAALHVVGTTRANQHDGSRELYNTRLETGNADSGRNEQSHARLQEMDLPLLKAWGLLGGHLTYRPSDAPSQFLVLSESRDRDHRSAGVSSCTRASPLVSLSFARWQPKPSLSPGPNVLVPPLYNLGIRDDFLRRAKPSSGLNHVCLFNLAIVKLYP